MSLGDANSLYFTAGAGNETNDIFGKLTVAPVPEPSAWGAMLAAGLGILSLARRFSKRPRDDESRRSGKIDLRGAPVFSERRTWILTSSLRRTA